MRLDDGDVRGRVGEHLGQGDVSRLVVVLLVAHDLELLAHLLAAWRNAVDRVLVVGHLGALGHVLVGDDQRLPVAHPVGEARAVHDRAHVPAAQLAFAAVVHVLVSGRVADGEDELLAHSVQHLRGDGSGHRVGVVTFAQRRLPLRGRRRRGGRLLRLPPGGSRRSGEDERCQKDDHALASSLTS